MGDAPREPSPPVENEGDGGICRLGKFAGRLDLEPEVAAALGESDEANVDAKETT